MNQTDVTSEYQVVEGSNPTGNPKLVRRNAVPRGAVHQVDAKPRQPNPKRASNSTSAPAAANVLPQESHYQNSEQNATAQTVQNSETYQDYDDTPFPPVCGQPPRTLALVPDPDDFDDYDSSQQSNTGMVVPTNQLNEFVSASEVLAANIAAASDTPPTKKPRKAPAQKNAQAAPPPPNTPVPIAPIEPEPPVSAAVQQQQESVQSTATEPSYDIDDIRNKINVEKNFSQSLLGLQNAPLPIVYHPDAEAYKGQIRIKPQSIKWQLEQLQENVEGEIRWTTLAYGATKIERGPPTTYMLTKEKVEGYFIARNFKDQVAGTDPKSGIPTMALQLDPMGTRFRYPPLVAYLPTAPPLKKQPFAAKGQQAGQTQKKD